jgi:hypothetical protein
MDFWLYWESTIWLNSANTRIHCCWVSYTTHTSFRLLIRSSTSMCTVWPGEDSGKRYLKCSDSTKKWIKILYLSLHQQLEHRISYHRKTWARLFKRNIVTK